MKSFKIVTLATGVALMPLFAFAAPGGMSCPMDKGGKSCMMAENGKSGKLMKEKGPKAEKMIEKMHKLLDLTEPQQDLLKQMVENEKSNREALREESKALREKMKSLHEAESVDEFAMLETGRKLGELKVKMFLAKENCLNSFRNALTPEQQEKFDQHRKEMKERMKEGMKNRGEKGKGKGMHGEGFGPPRDEVEKGPESEL